MRWLRRLLRLPEPLPLPLPTDQKRLDDDGHTLRDVHDRLDRAADRVNAVEMLRRQRDARQSRHAG